MNLFSIGDLEFTQGDESVSELRGKQDILKTHLPKHQCIDVDNLKDLSGKLPLSGEIFFIWSLKSFNAFTFIRHVIAERGKVEDVVISSYNISKAVFLQLMHLVDSGVIGHLHLTLSDVAKTRFPQIYDLVKSESLKRDQVDILYLWNHSKVSLIRSQDDYFIVEGSGNFSENSRHEQYVFLNNKDIYEFRAKWIRNNIL